MTVSRTPPASDALRTGEADRAASFGHDLARISGDAPAVRSAAPARPALQARGMRIGRGGGAVQRHGRDEGVAQRVVFKGSKAAQVKNKIKAWAGKAADDVIVWFEEALAVDLKQVESIMLQPFAPWWLSWENEPHVAVTADELSAPKGSAKKEKVEVDPLDAVRKKLPKKPPNFSTSELQAILDLKESIGWDAAIAAVTKVFLEAEDSRRLKAQRTAKYSAAKNAGDALFQTALLGGVWGASYGSAVAGTGGINQTLGTAFSDGDINTAAAVWHHHANVVPPATAPAGSESVTNFHVPGAPHYIEDKSTRKNNPDATRGRQADFVCEWGGTSINMHVDSTTKH